MSPKKKRTLPAWMRGSEPAKLKDKIDSLDSTNDKSPVTSKTDINSLSKVEEVDGTAHANNRSVDYLSESDSDHDGSSVSNSKASKKTSLTKDDIPLIDNNRTDLLNGNETDLEAGVSDSNRDSLEEPSSRKISRILTDDVAIDDIENEDGENSSNNVNDANQSATTSGFSSPVSRKSCYYGASCYRKNPQHRKDLAHPGDSDYQEPSSASHNNDLGAGSTADDRPLCEYGAACYRKNPQHRRDFRHDAPKNRKARPAQIQDLDSEDDGDFNESMGSDDFKPGESESDDSFVTSDSMESGNSDYDPEADEDSDKKKKRKAKQATQKRKKMKNN